MLEFVAESAEYIEGKFIFHNVRFSIPKIDFGPSERPHELLLDESSSETEIAVVDDDLLLTYDNVDDNVEDITDDKVEDNVEDITEIIDDEDDGECRDMDLSE